MIDITEDPDAALREAQERAEAYKKRVSEKEKAKAAKGKKRSHHKK